MEFFILQRFMTVNSLPKRFGDNSYIRFEYKPDSILLGSTINNLYILSFRSEYIEYINIIRNNCCILKILDWVFLKGSQQPNHIHSKNWLITSKTSSFHVEHQSSEKTIQDMSGIFTFKCTLSCEVKCTGFLARLGKHIS